MTAADSLSVQDPLFEALYVKLAVEVAAPVAGIVSVTGEVPVVGAVKAPPLWFWVIETVTVFTAPRSLTTLL